MKPRLIQLPETLADAEKAFRNLPPLKSSQEGELDIAKDG
jgi:hypothetical protein